MNTEPKPLTEERMESLYSYASGLATGWHGPEMALAGESMIDLWVEADRLRTERDALAGGVLAEIAAEQSAQHAKFGEQNHEDGTGPWVKNPDRMSNMEDQADVARLDCQEAANSGNLNWMLILREEVYEAFAEKDTTALRTELVQVAAVAATWVEAIDRRALGLGQDGEADAQD